VQTPFATATTVPAASSITFPAAGGYTAKLTLGSATIPAGTMAAVGLQDTAPVSVVPLARKRETALGTAALVYLSFESSQSIVASASLAVAIPNGIAAAGSSYWLALFDPLRPSLGWQAGFAGPATFASGTATFTLPAFTFVGGETYWMSVYAYPSTSAAPTAAPSISPLPVSSSPAAPTPTPTAGGVVVIQGVQ